MTTSKVTFAGAHNAGTGMSQRDLDCYITNHDMSLTEMLNFGIRFFDFDIKLDSNNILNTGHGPENWYYTYGTVQDAMDEIKVWMNEHKSEIAIVRFGQIYGSKEDALKKLKRTLEHTFDGIGDNVGLNGVYRSNEMWPTLAEAKTSNNRIFAFASIKDEDDVQNLGNKIIGELKVGIIKTITIFYTEILTKIFDLGSFFHKCT